LLMFNNHFCSYVDSTELDGTGDVNTWRAALTAISTHTTTDI
jgi:hypothetical protein